MCFIVYVDASSDCHSLDFDFGQNALGATVESNRRFSVKVIVFCEYHGIMWSNYERSCRQQSAATYYS